MRLMFALVTSVVLAACSGVSAAPATPPPPGAGGPITYTAAGGSGYMLTRMSAVVVSLTVPEGVYDIRTSGSARPKLSPSGSVVVACSVAPASVKMPTVRGTAGMLATLSLASETIATLAATTTLELRCVANSGKDKDIAALVFDARIIAQPVSLP